MAIAGKFLLGQNTTYKAGSSGGSATKVLTIENLPAHTHKLICGNASVMAIFTNREGGRAPSQSSGDYVWDAVSMTTSSTGSGASFNIMPPYLAVYIWQRTS